MKSFDYAEELESKLPQFLLEKFLSYLPSKPKVLDVACAGGRDTRYFKESGCRVVGIDTSSDMIDEALRRGKEEGLTRRQFKVMDLKSLDFKDASFDGIWCYMILNLVSKDELGEVFAQFGKLLKPKGVVFISVLSMGILPGAVSFYTLPEIEELLVEYGFEVVHGVEEPVGKETVVNVFASKER